MKEILYLDVYVLINGVMDLVSLMLAGLIASERGRGWRLVTAALFGSGTSLVLLVLSPPPFLTLLFGFLTFPVMILIAYGLRSVKRLFFISLFAFLSALFLGGALESVSYYTHRSGNATLFVFLAVILFAFGAFVIWGKGLRRKMESSVISLSIVHREKEAQLFGLLDSGSFLKEPTSGAPVILLKAEYASELLSDEEIGSIRCGRGDAVYPVPLRTASGYGCLFGFFPGAVYLHRGRKGKSGRTEPILIALDFSGGGFGGCPCLVPLSLV